MGGQGPYSRLPSREELNSKLKALYRLHLSVIRAVEIRLRGTNVGMAHQGLNRLEVIPVIQTWTWGRCIVIDS
jgi:hypothetical protein